MIRLVLVLLATILVVAFFVMNLHPVTLSLVVGPPVQIRLIFLIITAFVVGMVSGVVFKFVTARYVQRKRPRRGSDLGSYGDDDLLAD
jgi:uncharacterized integral membrane protein